MGKARLQPKRGGDRLPPPGIWLRLRAFWADLVEAFSNLGAVPLIAGLMGAVAYLLLFTNQGHDLAATVTEAQPLGAPPRIWFVIQTIALALASALLGGEAWFWSRRMVQEKCPDRRQWRPRWLLEWFPRLLGVAPFAIADIALLRSARGFWSPVLVLAVSGLTFLLVLRFRRNFIAWRQRRAAARSRTSLLAEERLPRIARLFITTSLASAAAMMIWISLDPVTVPQWIGAIGVVYLGVGLIIPVLAFSVHQGARLRLPVTGALVVAAVLWGALGPWLQDNHAVGRRAFGGGRDVGPAMSDHRAELKAAFERWYDQAPGAPGSRKLMIVVAAEGGASRAGLWTAEVLGRLQDSSHGAFAPSLFAISSVSGGSVGSAAFVSQVHENLPLPAPDGYRSAVRDASSGDYLSPVLAGLLFPDLAQRFLPTIPIGNGRVIGLPDRAEALEKAFEKGWRGHCLPGRCRPTDVNLWSGPFLNLWSGGPAWTPLLLVNGARAEDGRRVLTSPVRILPNDFPDAVDFHVATDGRDLSVSSAIHNGARFPLVSPGGTILGAGGRPRGHILDGGYFEGSGVTTAGDIVEAALRYGGSSRPVRPVVIELNNDTDSDPSSAAFDRGGAVGSPRRLAPSDTNYLLPDLLGPLQGVSQSRDGRAVPAAIALSRRLEPTPRGAAYQMVQLCNTADDGKPTAFKAPMDWALSGAAKHVMEIADDPASPGACPRNPGAFAVILGLIEDAAKAGPKPKP